MGVNSFKDYLDRIRADPKLQSIGTPSLAGLASLLVYQIRKTTNIDLQYVPYRGGQPLLTDLLGGQIPASASIMPDYLNEHRAGKLRILAVASENRSVLAPDIPTFRELGYPFYAAKTSFGVFAKSGVPAAFVAECASALTEALAEPEIVERLHQLGLEPAGGTPEQFQQKLIEDRTRWAPLIKESGMKID
jgi:tripartite-type tricarboxylate transporter receptor subunit TctC